MSNDGTKTLTKDTHFTVSYKNNTAVGTATAIVTGKGNYTGTINKSFTIKSAQTKSITGCTVNHHLLLQRHIEKTDRDR